jgi:L-asparagine transporter-like permease
MDTTEASGPSSPGTREKKYLSVRQAAFIGVGAMVGAGIFALLGAAGEVALVIFTMITAAHLRIRAETGANLLMLILAIVAAGAVFVTFVFTTLIHEPASIATLAGILVLSVALDYGWKHFRDTRTKNVQLAH